VDILVDNGERNANIHSYERRDLFTSGGEGEEKREKKKTLHTVSFSITPGKEEEGPRRARG